MKVVLVLAGLLILLAIYYPSMEEHVRKGKRAEGKSALLRTANLQERHREASGPGAYTQDVALLYGKPAGTAIYAGEDPADARSAYRVVVEPETAACPLSRCFQLMAVPVPGFNDPDCGNYTLKSTGERIWDNKHKDKWWVWGDECKW